MDIVKIRPATENDIPIVLNLLYELGRPTPQEDSDVDAFRKLVKKYLADSDKEILVAELNEIEIVGVLSMIFLSRLNQINFELYIPELVVLEKFQNQGIGKKLISYSIILAKQKKCHRIRLESGNQRTNSHQFYKKIGFEQSGFSFIKNLE